MRSRTLLSILSYCCSCLFFPSSYVAAEIENEQISGLAKLPGEKIRDSLMNQIQSLFGNAGYNIADDGTITSLFGKTLGLGLTEPDTIDRIYQFFELYKELFQIENPREELSVLRFARNQYGYHSIKLEQRFHGVKVRYGGYNVKLWPDTSFIESVSGMFHPQARSVNTTPTITKEQAIDIALDDTMNAEIPPGIHPNRNSISPNIELIIEIRDGVAHLEWPLSVYVCGPTYYIDAHTGAILEIKNEVRE